MSIIPLELFKLHTRTDDFDADDAILAVYLDAAEAKVIRDTRRALDELLAMGDGVQLPLELQQAAMMLAAHWYANREAASPVELRSVPLAYENIVNSYTNLRP